MPAGFVWATGATLWFMANGLFPVSGQVQVIWLAAMLTVLGMIGAGAMSGGLDVRTALARLKLGPWIAIGFSVGFGLATLFWLGDIQGYRGFITRSSLMPGAIIAAVGFLALIVAYCSTPSLLRDWGRKMDRVLRGGGTISPGAWSVWTLWGLALFAQTVFFRRGTLGYLSDSSALLSTTSSLNAVLSGLTDFGLLATVVAGWRFAISRRPGAMVLLMWVASTQMVIGLFSGMKEAAIIQLVAVVVGYSARGRLRFGPLVISGLVVLFVITPFVTAYRAAVLNGAGRLSPTQALQTVRFDQLIGGVTSGNATEGSLADSSSRWSRLGDVAIIVQKTPTTIDYISPLELLGGPALGLVPRSLWPGKPVLDAGYQVNQQYYEMPRNVYSSAAVTPYGDLYRHGGVEIVIVGMAILGMFVRTVDDRGGTVSDMEPRLLFLPMLLFSTLVKQEMDYLAMSASLVSIILVAALASRLVSRRVTPN